MVVQVRRKVFRAASLPVEYDEPVGLTDPALNAHRVRMISNALDDSDAMTLASRRNDQQLMKDINNRIACASLVPSSPVLPRRVVVYRAPTPTRRPHLPIVSSVIASVNADSATSKVGSSYDDSDVNHAVDLMMPLTSRYLRAGSLPPVLARSHPLIDAGHGRVVVKAVRNGPGVVSLNGPGAAVMPYYYPREPYPHSRYIVEKVPVPDSYYYFPQYAANLLLQLI